MEIRQVVEQKILDVPMTLLNENVKIQGRMLQPEKAVAFLINHAAENTLMNLRFALKDVKMLAAELGFKVDDKRFNAGTFIIPVEENPSDTASRLKQIVEELGLTAHGVKSMPKVKIHPLAVPRIAILHTWIFTQNEGWFRLAFEKLGIPYSYISVHDIRDTKDLKSLYDVIIFPPVMFGKAQRPGEA